MSRTGATPPARARRLFVEQELAEGARIELGPEQLHYVRDVVRLSDGDEVLVFNGRDGEWSARIAVARRAARLMVESLTRTQDKPCDLHFLFAPLKHARLDYMAQKATELGASRLQPVMTRRTSVGRVNLRRMRANAIEAAEQCGLTSVPEVAAPVPLGQVIAGWPASRKLVFADEAAGSGRDFTALAALRGLPMALIVGPEGGFTAQEREALRALAGATAISLGPRVMRADTAAVAALALVQALAGDWTVANG
jgi:16S rRNA (uracil1498-N3)-methyltransferase